MDDGLCDRQLEPADTQSCSEEPCPPGWVEGPWSNCTKHCGEGGEQTREIKCEQIISGGIASVVDDSQCLEKVGPKGLTKQECNKDVDCPLWHEGPWKPVSYCIVMYGDIKLYDDTMKEINFLSVRSYMRAW